MSARFIWRNCAIAQRTSRARLPISNFSHHRLHFHAMSKVQEPRVDKVSPLPSEEAKWVEFQKIEWTDQEGKSRMWEAGEHLMNHGSRCQHVLTTSHSESKDKRQERHRCRCHCADTASSHTSHTNLDHPAIPTASGCDMCRVPGRTH